ncbi:MAG: DnaB-like helicase C-terminal domain-containing protein [Pseudomonadota bacterium]|nr:DnaB-like helicase C-terminal domain-containing protein [Pseudomonadota bacterium]
MTALRKPIPPETERTPAHNLDAEAALLGAMMIDNRLVDDILSILSADDFFEPFHGELFNKIVATVSLGEVANPVTLRPRFRDHPALKELGGPAYLAQLTEQSAVLIAAKDFAHQIAQLAKHRRFEAQLVEALRVLREDEECDIGAAVKELEGALASTESPGERNDTDTGTQLVERAINRVDRIQREGKRPGLTCKTIPEINALTGGIEHSDLVVLAGRPAMGKTATAISLSLGLAMNGHGVAFISYEMSNDQLALRVASDLTHWEGTPVPHAALRDGNVTRTDIIALNDARTAVGRLPVLFLDRSAQSPSRLAIELRRTKRIFEAKGRKLDVAVVDYLQLMHADGRVDGRTNEITQITQRMKSIAKELGIAIVLLSQLSRAVEQRENKRPMLSDLRDSGSIEQDADSVCFVYRDEYYLEQMKPEESDVQRYDKWRTAMDHAKGRIEFIMAKSRHGVVGRRLGRFFGESQAVRGADTHHREEDYR